MITPRSAVLGSLLVLAACTPATPEAAPSNPPSSPTSSPAGLDCPSVDLRTPSGAPIDLTGMWTGGNTIHEVRQLRSCVWWMGLSNWPGDEVGSAWAFVFSGRLRPDFTLTGVWAEIYTGEARSPGEGVVTFEVEITEEDGAEVIVLRRDNTLEIEAQHGDYVADTLRRVE
jgi:hypothetical protein